MCVCSRRQTLVRMHAHPDGGRLCQVVGGLRAGGHRTRPLRGLPPPREDPQCARGLAQTGNRSITEHRLMRPPRDSVYTLEPQAGGAWSLNGRPPGWRAGSWSHKALLCTHRAECLVLSVAALPSGASCVFNGPTMACHQVWCD